MNDCTVSGDESGEPHQTPGISQRVMKEDQKAMFRAQESNATVLENLEASREVSETFARKSKEPAKPQGLCRNCALADTCLYRRDGQAVWYCEEYQ
jgi:hypothetical protein